MSLESEETYYKNLNKCRTTDKIASNLIVAVMTVCGSLGSNIDLLEIFDYYMEEGCGLFELSYVPNSKKSKDGKKNKAFYNCLNVIFHYKDINDIESKIASKIFPNGSIQLPGCRTIDAVNKAPEILYNFVKDITEKCELKKKNIQIIKNPENFVLKNVRIVMINSNFVFNNGILQERLKNIINNDKFDGNKGIWRMGSFQPEKYSGCNIRYMTEECRKNNSKFYLESKKIPMKLNGQVSIFIFRSGKGTITGAKNTNDLLETYIAITDLVRKNKDQLFYDHV